MARLFSISVTKKNGTLNSSPVTTLLNSKNVISVQDVNENFTGNRVWYSLLKMRVYDDAQPDQYYTTTPASTITATINTANTSNNIETIPLTVQTPAGVNSFVKYFNPRFITEVYAVTSSTATSAYTDSTVVYEEPQAPQGDHKIIRVDDPVSAIQALTNA